MSTQKPATQITGQGGINPSSSAPIPVQGNTPPSPHEGTTSARRTLSADGLPKSPVRILAADDEHLVAAELTLLLTDLGYTVVGPASDGESAVRLAQSALPDLALLDIRMPKRDGLSAAKEMFDELAIPVVILSAYSDEEYVKTAQEAGVFGYLIKPVQKEQLRVCISVAWSRFTNHVAQQGENALLRKRLEDRKTIESAKWLLVSRKSITEPEAMKLLQKTARDSRQQLVVVATGVLKGESI